MGPISTRTHIMLYFFPASWTLNGIATKANDVLSTIDKQFIAGAQMYPKTGETTTTAVELEVNAKRRTAASIGKFGEEDLVPLYRGERRPVSDRYARFHRRRHETLRPEQ